MIEVFFMRVFVVVFVDKSLDSFLGVIFFLGDIVQVEGDGFILGSWIIVLDQKFSFYRCKYCLE